MLWRCWQGNKCAIKRCPLHLFKLRLYHLSMPCHLSLYLWVRVKAGIKSQWRCKVAFSECPETNQSESGRHSGCVSQEIWFNLLLYDLEFEVEASKGLSLSLLVFLLLLIAMHVLMSQHAACVAQKSQQVILQLPCDFCSWGWCGEGDCCCYYEATQSSAQHREKKQQLYMHIILYCNTWVEGLHAYSPSDFSLPCVKHSDCTCIYVCNLQHSACSITLEASILGCLLEISFNHALTLNAIVPENIQSFGIILCVFFQCLV